MEPFEEIRGLISDMAATNNAPQGNRKSGCYIFLFCDLRGFLATILVIIILTKNDVL